MGTEGQTSQHLLLAVIISVFSGMMILITVVMPWELWMVPVILTGNFSVWFLHIGRIGTGAVYENLCAGVMMVEFFFFGVHRESLFDMPAVACIMILSLFMLNKKWMLLMIEGLYLLGLLYHFLIFHTISYDMEVEEAVRLVLGTTVTLGGAALARYWTNRRREQRKRYEGTFAELETAGRQNAVFLSNVSHELRTPINMVIGISEVILGKEISPELRADIQSIKTAGRRLSNQINNMMDYTEIVEGTLTPAREEYMITSVLNDVITMTAMQSNIHQLELIFDINPKIPAVLIGDAEKISHVLKILVENSIKFTEEGGLDVRIDYREENYGINLIIDIYDTGIGMTDSQLTQMYDEFYQADSGSNRFAGGLGLGLPIARGLLNAMGGFLHFDSQEQEGLQAHIAIPQRIADDRPCIALNHPEQLCIACYFRPEKYVCDEIREYYDGLIANLMYGLGIEGHQAHNFEGLLKLQRMYDLTHVFIAQREYEENVEYYEELAETLRVVVIAEKEYVLSRESRLLAIHKPFSALAVANLLNGETGENGFEEAQAAGRRPFTCEGVRVLVVDDEEMNLVVAKGVLGTYGIEVETCLSGREAIERCMDVVYDVVFLDHMMPGFDGVETLRYIREINDGMYQDLPVIALTANTISGAREMFRNEGFTEFIPKPIERAVLERTLRKVLPKDCIRYGGEKAARQSGADLEEPAIETGGRGEADFAVETGGRGEADFAVEAGIAGEADFAAKTGIAGEAGYIAVPEEAEVADVLAASGMPKEAKFQEGSGGEALAETASGGMSQEEEGASSGSLLPYDRLVSVGMNVEMGLDYCCGEEEFYLEMLRMFYSQAEAKRDEIISLYEEANWKDYAIKVHALKSTSLTIGAEELSAQAKALEMAGKSGDVEYIHENHAALLRMYEEICESIAGL